MSNNAKRARYWEIDAMRGVAIVSMIGFHTAFVDLFCFDILLCSHPAFWWLVPMLIGGAFLTLAGLSLHIGAAKGRYPTLMAGVRRSSFLFAAGMVLTLGTCLFGFGGGIYFGILHCIGLSSLIGFLVLHWPRYLLLAASASVIVVGMYCRSIYAPCWHISLFWLYPCSCAGIGDMFDYYPLVPWVGFLLGGLLLGKQFYPQGNRSFPLPSFLERAWLVRALGYLGRRSLLIYFVHLPIVYAALYFVNYC